MKKIVSLAFVLVLLSTAVVMRFVRPAVAQGTFGTIYIRSNGSVDPLTAPIQRDGNIYTFTDNISSSIYGDLEYAIVIEKDNVVVDGAGYTVQGTWMGYYYAVPTGIGLEGRSNVIIKNINIKGFFRGIEVEGLWGGGSDNVIQTNNITNNRCGVYIGGGSNNNKIYGNNITNNSYGVWFDFSNWNNRVYGNNITNNELGICLDGVIYDFYKECPHENTIYENNIADNTEAGVKLLGIDNIFYHNNFLNNTIVIGSEFYSGGDNLIKLSKNIFDNGYPSGGNYWNSYTGVDIDDDGIGNTAYVINEDNRDNYPLMSPWSPTWSPLPVKELPFWMQWWFWATIAVAIVALAGAVYLLIPLKEEKATNTNCSSTSTEGV